MLKGNAVTLEWLTSPIVYESCPGFADEMLDLAHRAANRLGVARHYFHLGTRQWRVWFDQGDSGKLKTLFYALRPAMALRWLEVNPDASVPPMHFQGLLEGCDMPAEVAQLCGELIAKKAVTRELGSSQIPSPIIDFIASEFARAEPCLQGKLPALNPAVKADAERFFFKMAAAVS